MRPTYLLLLTATLAFSGCAAERETANRTPAKAWTDQVARGAEIYASTCARCHGTSGEGTSKGLPLVGASALPLHPRPDQVRSGEFRTAMDIALFATANMPPDVEERAELKEQQYWDVLAFALSANGVVGREPVSPENASEIVLHP